jgi:hypothetical protein
LHYAPESHASQDLQTLAKRLQCVRLSMADWLADKKILRNWSAKKLDPAKPIA